LQHAAKPPLKAEEVEIQQAELIVWLVIAPAQTVTVVEFKQLQLVHKNAIIPGDSALEFCAALCRFTI
jgi:hypothetical protein